MKRILVGVDGSEPSDRAVELAAELAGPVKAQVTVAHVINPLAYPLDAYPAALVDPEVTAAVAQQERRVAEAVTSAAAERLRGKGLAVETLLLTGNPPLELAESAERGGFDLVAVGSNGKGALRRMLLGSTSDRLVRLSKRPVLVVH
ncbi:MULTISPECIES: universal stress protein [Myxococcaceae]|uniref:universal stress protein n=1 Tax=Myxococcaceae TaxID=31 RepID=UPI00188E00DF|nr:MULTISPECIES: universal stress protein [Myxococcaceae]MBF5045701.1 universal stress protein [Simulacricoccus sp. 17bor-14]